MYQQWRILLVEFCFNSAPLFPRGMLKQIFQFHYGNMRPEPSKQLDHFLWVAFADSMPMQNGSFTVDEIYFQMT
jgi:hypothetical protein